MTYHQSSAVSVAAALTAATVIVVGYRLGRTHSAWRALHDARQALRTTRRDALSHTVSFVAGSVLILAMLFVAGFNAAR
jgi:acetyl esterase/lipase